MENITPDILKPARYINREWNSIHKESKDASLKVALCFPDIYEIGMSHLGMRILYGVLNQEKDIICERVFAPWSDMEKKMRSDQTPLVSLESQRRLRDFHIIGFSLQYEMNLVDVLNMLDLGGVRVRAIERHEGEPLVIAGGPCSFNPEPMSEFIDAFVIGEAEEAILEIAEVVKGCRVQGEGWKRIALKEISKIEGVYAPQYTLNPVPCTIKKRIIKDLDKSYFPTKPIVPYIQIVHDRVPIEIMRGCPHRCRFCQACKIFHPLRMRSVKRILEIAERSIKSTGYEEISLLSLSTGDYPYLEELVGRLKENFKNRGVKISLPSLRARSFNSNSNGGWDAVKKGSLTFAPEAGSERLRGCLNKNMENKDIIQKANAAIRSGWKKVKLYFMIGLPGERDEDLDAIIELASQIRRVSLSISPFIPKPYSEFETQGMDNLEILNDKKEYLKAKRGKKTLRMDFHNIEMSRIEAILSRGDRKMGALIYRAWQKGARLQGWTEYFDYNLWKECFKECALDPETYLNKGHKKESLPWSFIEA